MIEKYFRAGIRYKWTKPRDAVGPKDGEIIDSKELATPLIYDGLDGQLIDPYLMQVNVSTLGLRMRTPIQYAWLDYAPGRTARLPIGPYDVLTGYMSGCLLAYWSYRGIRFVGHVGTMDHTNIDRQVKRTFAFAMEKSTKGFSPADAWPPSEVLGLAKQIKPYPGNKVLGLITTRGEFYSILMLSLKSKSGSNVDWCVGGIKKIKPINHDVLKLRLLRND